MLIGSCAFPTTRVDAMEARFGMTGLGWPMTRADAMEARFGIKLGLGLPVMRADATEARFELKPGSGLSETRGIVDMGRGGVDPAKPCVVGGVPDLVAMFVLLRMLLMGEGDFVKLSGGKSSNRLNKESSAGLSSGNPDRLEWLCAIINGRSF